ncbi:MAG: sialate O-acetylesterase [Colwellia sp.]|nr:sialate O-acetylesterase [Colwellia sp.]
MPKAHKLLSKVSTYLLFILVGILWQRYYGVHQFLLDIGIRTIEFSDSSTRIKKDTSTLKKPFVILIAGQSNVANTVSSLSKSTPNIYNFYNSALYHAEDPLLGATDKQGSLWITVGKKLLEKTSYNEVVIINVARSNSSISDWVNNGKFNNLIVQAINSALLSGLKPNVFLWGQGERDALDNMKKSDYRKMLANFVSDTNKITQNMPIIISLSSRCFSSAENINIRQAQMETIQRFNFVFQGPDTDELGSDYRYDDCHFNTKGKEISSMLWTKYIINTLPSS